MENVQDWKAAIAQLDECRKALGKTHEQLATITEKKRTEITRFFSAKNEPGIGMFYLICNALEITIHLMPAKEYGDPPDILAASGKLNVLSKNPETVADYFEKPKKKVEFVVIPPDAMKASAKYNRLTANLYKWEGSEDVFKIKKYSGGGLIEQYFLNKDKAIEFLDSL